MHRRQLLKTSAAVVLGLAGLSGGTTAGTNAGTSATRGAGERSATSSGGDVRWETRSPPGIIGSPTVVGGTVYFGDLDGNVHGLDADSGDQEWGGYDLGGAFRSSPTVVDGVVYVGLFESMIALDAGVDASSEDSRVELGTLGHHDDWADVAGVDASESTETPAATPDQASTPTSSPQATESATRSAADDGDGVGAPGPGILGALAGLGGAGYLLGRLNDGENDR